LNLASIHFHSEEADYTPSRPEEVKKWIGESITAEKKTIGELNFIFCTDEYLLVINQEYLQHDTYTDVITFDYVEKEVISGDIFISIERIEENAVTEGKTFEEELHRVMIHGVLHLMGYKDKTAADARKIRAKEDFYLTLRS
jgi:rRNA maturation RNase YbeY